MYTPEFTLESLVGNDLVQCAANDITKYIGDFTQSVLRQYVSSDGDVNARKGCLRMSSLGKAAVLQLLEFEHIREELLGYGVDVIEDNNEERKTLMFHFGDMFEAWFEFMLKRHGLEVITPPESMGRQWEFEYEGIKGHADILVKHPTEDVVFLIDTKASGSYAVKDLQKNPWLSKPEYVTQVSLYAESYRRLNPQYTVIPVIASLNMDERRVYYTYVEPELQAKSLSRASKIIKQIPDIESFSDYWGKVQAPPGVRVEYRNKPVGEYLTVHPSMKFCRCLDLFYHTQEQKVKIGSYTKKVKVVGTVLEDGTLDTWYKTPQDAIAELKANV